MSQTIQQIEAEINAAIAAESALANLNTSNVAEWLQFKNIFVQANYSLQKLWDAFKTDIAALAAGSRYGTLKWFQEISLLFQYGDIILHPEYSVLSEKNGTLFYPVVDATKQIITRCATSEINRTVIIKVAKGTTPTALLPAEKLAFDAYIKDIKPAGVKHQVVTALADRVKVNMNVYYDPLLIVGNLTTLIEGTIIPQFLAAITFDGVFDINRFRDAIEGVPGVANVGDADIQNVSIKQAGLDILGNPYPYTTVSRRYSPYSGYYIWNTQTETLPEDCSVINYIPIS